MSVKNESRTYKYNRTITLVVMVCGECGVAFGLEEDYRQERLNDHQLGWYCPNGHSRVFTGKTPAQKLEDELKAERDYQAMLQARLDQAEASRRAFKGQATRLRNRALAGECPVCGQHLRDLSRHMGRMHPDEKPEAEE